MPSDMPTRSCREPMVITSDLRSAGVSLIVGMKKRCDLLNLASALATVIPHRDSDPDGVTAIEDRGASEAALVGFTRSALPLHTDRSSAPEPPALLITVCARTGASGGQSLLADGAAVYQELAATAPESLEVLCTPRSAMFGGADGHLGSVFTRRPDGLVTVRFRLDALARFGPAVAPHLPVLPWGSSPARYASAATAAGRTGDLPDAPRRVFRAGRQE